MKVLKIIIAVAICSILLFSCKDEDKLDPNKRYIGLGGDSWVKTELDEWIYDNLTKPYNINVKYKWDHNEVDYKKTLVPIDEDKVKPIMNMIKQVWIEPYNALAGTTFIKRYCPKKYFLVGSPQYNDSTITLGEAEGGVKVTLYRLNWFSSTNRELICEIMKTVHHEFGHILNQNILYPQEFDRITPSGYTSAWTLTANSDVMARDLGFISRYARASGSEDFVEMIARIAVYGRPAFKARVAASTDVGKIALLKKEEYVVNYLRDVWGINFYDSPSGDKGLVTLVQEAIDNVVAGNL